MTAMMPTRRILLFLKFFAVSAAIALAVALLAPIPLLRVAGYIALACALLGVALYLYLLRDADPHAWMVLRYRTINLPERAHARWRAAFQHHRDVHEV
jgi:hypothetical protein